MGENRHGYEFDEFRVDAAKRRLLRGGEVVPLYSKAFDVLLLLLENTGRDLTREQILEAIWPGQVLEDSNLTVNISAIRKALGENAANPRYLITIPGRGYRFIAPLKENANAHNQLVVTSETISEVVVEEEIYDANEIGFSNGNDKRALTQPPQLTSAHRAIVRRPLLMLALVGGAALLVIATVFAWNAFRSRAATRFGQIKLRQITNDGAVV